MHFAVLTALQFPFAADLTKNNLLHIPTPMTLHDLVRIQGEFERDMTSIIDTTMEPYYEATENPEYLVFEDMDKEVRSGYENGTLECVRMPDGKIVTTWSRRFTNCFTVEDGVIYERNWGPLRHNKRTKRAKQIQFLPKCPVRRLYKTMESYAEDYHGYHFHKGYQAYGYMTNPNGHYDWYQVGGRWKLEYLIHSDDPFFIHGESSWCNKDETKEAPQGYRWVSGARKSSICWAKMKELAVEEATATFQQLEQWFTTGVKPEGERFIGTVTEQGIAGWGGMLYEKDMTLQQYIAARGLAPGRRHLPSTYYILEDGEWKCADEYAKKETATEDALSWDQVIADYYDSLSDDAVLVTIDCHD